MWDDISLKSEDELNQAIESIKQEFARREKIAHAKKVIETRTTYGVLTVCSACDGTGDGYVDSDRVPEDCDNCEGAGDLYAVSWPMRERVMKEFGSINKCVLLMNSIN